MNIRELNYFEDLNTSSEKELVQGGVWSYASTNTYAGKDHTYATGSASAYSGHSTYASAYTSAKDYGSVKSAFANAHAKAWSGRHSSSSWSTSIDLYIRS